MMLPKLEVRVGDAAPALDAQTVAPSAARRLLESFDSPAGA